MITLLIVLTLLILATVISIVFLEDMQDQNYYKPFVYETVSLDLEDFHDFYNQKGNIFKSPAKDKFDGPGVYVLYNQTQDKYYFGQGDLVIEAIYDRLTAESNEPIVEEVSNLDQFYIKMLLLNETSYDNLADLETATRHEFAA